MLDTGSEHDDNMRFALEVSEWLGVPLEVLKSDKYNDTFDVYKKTGWLVGPKGARCSLELKKAVRLLHYGNTRRVQVYGFDFDEKERALKFSANNPLVIADYPLIRRELTKSDCRQILAQAGIDEPVTYKLGFNNANCLKTGCVKGGMGYWNKFKKEFPDAFWRMAGLEREMDVAICKSYAGDGKRKKVFLDKLTPEMGDYDAEPSFQCGLFCGEY